MHSLFDWLFSLIVLFIKQVRMCVCVFFYLGAVDQQDRLVPYHVSRLLHLLVVGPQKKKEKKIKRKPV
jgi:hypothetical protein